MTVVVGICGGIAAYKAVSVVRELVLRGHDVHVVPTEAALRFVGAPTLEAISRNPVHTSVFDDVAQVRHVALGQQADLIVVAPATAHTLAKLAHGLSDDLLGTTVLASTAPLVVAPAMHTQMWQAASTTDNVALLRARGVVVVGPDDGPLTGGDSGPGRLSEPDVIVDAALAVVVGRAEEARQRDLAGRDLASRDLAGRVVVVTAGGTREPLDPVRWLGNRSSGKQGLAVAREAAARGARVVFVAAHVDDDVAAAVAQLPGTEVRTAGTAAELDVATTAAAESADVLVMAAAVADWTPASVADAKLKKDDAGDRLTLDLVRTVDVLAGLVARRREGQVVVGFAAETSTGRDDLIALGRRKVARKPADLLVLNQVGWAEGFGRDESVAVLLGRDGTVVGESSGTKADTARALLDAVVSLLGAASAGAASATARA
ncbi:bifunctional phosphopantothenoylcysteine decarboxylase/phosphopantothenate--cysteine ligase CoaBC [Frigoribacterium sp. PvP032]|uniref:bifunctional phosphopantothenoylcysteine decarboxylase/phosphopantothenate--cysteine ligase CoaBC n=1 Tax=Frigoribacterium sp. PvP032 TaxID=2806589 RepID=UPI001AE463E3|nr:bifunctional phosphopantothenoylcysteine decarboxylase/phosphopantothenate--cysteine ligase CoaBC [Frigoribacterium sp. PvP032]